MCRAHQSSLDDVNDETMDETTHHPSKAHFEDSSGGTVCPTILRLYGARLPDTLAAQSLSTRLLVAKASKDIGQRRRQTVKDSGLCFLDLPWPFDVTSCFLCRGIQNTF